MRRCSADVSKDVGVLKTEKQERISVYMYSWYISTPSPKIDVQIFISPSWTFALCCKILFFVYNDSKKINILLDNVVGTVYRPKQKVQV